jgi:two-component sensor histidine kinase
MASEFSDEAESPRFDRFRAMLRGLRLSGMCVLYQDRDLNILMVENAPDFWPSRQEMAAGGDYAIFDSKTADRTTAAKRAVLAGGDSVRLEVSVADNDEPRWFEMTVEPDDGHSTGVRGLYVSVVEITDIKHREQVLKTLLREVSHRSKNLLAIIQSIASQTARFSESMDDFLLKFRGRLLSLSQSQDLVTDSNWRGAKFSELLDMQLSRYASANEFAVTRHGADCFLTPNAALHVGLAIHELAVNSAAYGALADGNGSVTVELSRPNDAAAHMTMVWSERLGHAGHGIDTARFGSAVLEKVVPVALDSQAYYEIEDHLVVYRLDIPQAHCAH